MFQIQRESTDYLCDKKVNVTRATERKTYSDLNNITK